MSTDAPNVVERVAHRDEEPHPGDHGHPGDMRYVKIALILAVITAAEVAVSYIDIGPAFVPALMIMMIAKFVIVAAYFMHLKFDSRLFTRIFGAGLLLAVAVYLVFLTDMQFWAS